MATIQYDYSQSPYGGGPGYRFEGPSPMFGGDQQPPGPGVPRDPSAPASGPSQSDQDWFRQITQGLAPNRASLAGLESQFTPRGIKLGRPNARGDITKIQLADGSWVRVTEGSEGPGARWTWVVQPSGAGVPGAPSQFSDPASRQLEAYLTAQMGRLESQRSAQEQANVGFRQRQGEAQASADRLTKFLQERAGRLQGPAYTGTEQEILRTQQLDPMERDRQAARQRAMHNISARGFEPESGIAQELLNQVDRGFDEQRAQAQGQLGYRQIMEQRSREQEAQALLAQIPQLQRAGASGDLDFLQALDAAVNRPSEAQMPLSMLQYQIPQQALQQALAAMGMGPSQNDLFNQAMGLYGVQQQQRNQGLDWYQTLGAALPYLLGSGRP